MRETVGDSVVGVDGGGSKTRVVIANVDGDELVSVTGTGSTVKPGNAAHSADVIAALVQSARESAELAALPRVLYVGIAGVGREREREELHRALTERAIADEVIVVTDATTALSDAFGEGPGIILIAGTGSIAYGRGPAGAYARCGGWGATFGDEGGGAWIGRRALSIVTASADGREPETALLGAILTAAQVNDVAELIPWSLAADAAALAALAPAVMTTALQGDLRANSLVNLAVEELMLHVRALARQLFADERAAFDVAMTGGLLTRGTLIRKRLDQRIRAALPGATVKPGEVIPVRGAVRAARAARAALAAL